MPKCRTCGAQIKWCEMASGKKMPLDAESKNMIQVKEGIGQVISVYMPHWSTCLNSGPWKKKTKKGGKNA